VVLQAGLEVLDVVGDRQELEDLDALALRITVELAVLGEKPFSFPENTAELSVTHPPRLLLAPRPIFHSSISQRSTHGIATKAGKIEQHAD
jgi:hypothetical protein